MAPRSKIKRRGSRVGRVQAPVFLTLAVLSLTSAIGYRFYNEPQLAVDDRAPETLRALEDASVEDTETTEQMREAARTEATPVLKIDTSVNQQIFQLFQRQLDRGDEFRGLAGDFPFTDTSDLSLDVQRFLRQIPEWELLSILEEAKQTDRPDNEGSENSVAPNPQQSASPSTPAPNSDSSSTIEADEQAQNAANRDSTWQLAVLELQSYRRRNSSDDFLVLENTIKRSRQNYEAALADIATIPGENNTINIYDEALLRLTDEDWDATKIGMRRSLDRILTQGIPPGLPTAVLQETVRSHVELDVPTVSKDLAASILLDVIDPNLTEDAEQTQLQAEQAAKEVEPEIVLIRGGEVIVHAGEVITQRDFVLLDHFGMSQRQVNVLALIGFAGLVTGAIAIFLVVERFFHSGLRRRDHALILLLTLSAPLSASLVAVLGVPATSIPAIALLVTSFYGAALSVSVVGLLSIVLFIGMEIGVNTLVASAVSSFLGAVMAGRLRSREELALLGLAVGIVQGTVFLILSLIATSGTPVWLGILSAAGVQALMGLGWSIIAIGVSPYLEHVFDLVTPIRLIELTNPNRPLLQRLASEAPGTFQHTLFVASLAEAAARALGCNVELVRAGTLYHDIGKMHDAQGFIENQMGGPNKHDAIDDPWESAKIIKKHVTEGLVMAKKCRLPRAIQAFIPEHQGNMLITYFYYQAQERAKQDPAYAVHESDFRYDGPTPQSRETGIVMLADSCEAALRSLKDATPQDALAMVNRIMRARWQDNQLADSGLTRADLGRIAEIFVQVWQQFNHQRIPYPKAALNPQPSPTFK